MRVVVSLLILAVSASAATAQSNPQAEELFRQGRKAMEARRYAEACEAFQGSQRIEASVATLMNLADCREKNGQLATAWGLFLQVGTVVRDDPKQAGLGDVAAKRALALESRLSRLTINVPETSKVEGLRIVENGTEVDPATWNRSIPVDGGPYEIAASAPGVQPWTATVTVGVEGDKQSVDVPRFEPVAGAGVGGIGGPRGGEGGGATDRPARGHRRRPLALGLAGAALVAGGTAVFFELQGRSALDDAKAATTQSEQDERYDDANGKHHLAQGLGIAAGAFAAGAAFVWFTGRESAAPRSVSIAPVVSPGRAGLAVGGSF